MTQQAGKDRPILLGAGILGFAGVAAAAASAHAAGDPQMMSAVALVCLAHAPALLAIALLGRRDFMLRLAALLLFVGAALFSTDITMRVFGHGRLFAMAAPTGGTIMLIGWLAVMVSTFTPNRS